MSDVQPATVRIGDGEPFEAFSWPRPAEVAFGFQFAALGKVLRAGAHADAAASRAESRRQSPGGPGPGVAGISRVWWVWDELLPLTAPPSALDGRYRRRQRNRVKRRRR